MPQRNTQPDSRACSRGLSLVEVLVAIAIVAVLAAIAVPTISNLHDTADKTKSQSNAQHIAQISSSLASMGVAHVLPDSLGGVEATARLLREGVTVPDGVFAGQFFVVSGLTDDEITEAAAYLQVIYDFAEVRLTYRADI
ncbi:MAG: prepilin-type N-terminal cleavage/methylation domain-containing protein [Verrucomicrobiota bacterium]